MKTIGLLGGMSFESTIDYYRIINETVNKFQGGNHSAEIVLASVDFGLIEKLQHEGKWQDLAELLSRHINVRLADADFIIICTNTMHKLVPEISKMSAKKILHIADVTGAEIAKQRLRKVALLGTKFTMQESFYKDKLSEYGIEVIIPQKGDCDYVHNVIYEQLCKGIILEDSRLGYQWIIEELASRGAEGVVLGCTEIPLLIKDACIPVFDTTRLHAEAAAREALALL